ncbi:unnamed protein product [Caenorhabditis auriculariae]|uniref:CUB-like domain-containing protein n=1 Tax=Caenorhabditis auriculariae TaxID=2777116 RepID=A0A8S1HX61_9PELO|nr:unnamed protein product [Caenorhabditis auriculariae]
MLWFLFIALFFQKVGAQITCPTKVYSPADDIVYFPNNNIGLTNIPSNFACSYKFNIPPGFVARITVTSNMATGDVLSYTNSLGTVARLPNPISLYPRMIATPSGSLNIATNSSRSQFNAKLEFVNLVENYKPFPYSSGDYAFLKDLDSSSFISFTPTAGKNAKIRLTIAQKQQNVSASDLAHIFVYQGTDLKGNYLGVLSEVAMGPSGRGISLVNVYDSYVDATVVANDDSAISQFSDYQVFEINPAFNWKFVNQDNVPSAYTFILPSPDTPQAYLTYLNFMTPTPSLNQAYVSFQSQTPTKTNFETLRYTFSLYTSNSMPQNIPCQYFTMFVYRTTAQVNFDTVARNYNALSDGRNGYVFSRTYWSVPNPNLETVFYGQNNLLYSIKTQVLYLSLQRNEYLDVQINQGGAIVSEDKYTSSLVNAPVKTVSGDGFRMFLISNSTNTAAKVYYSVSTSALPVTPNCPTGLFSPLNGSVFLPVNSSLTRLNSGFNCVYGFNFPAGFVAKLTITSIMASGDFLSYTNSLGQVTGLPNQMTNYQRVIASPSGSFSVSTTTSNSLFSLRVDFISLLTYRQNLLNMGGYTSLSSLSGSSFITFTNQNPNGKVQLTYDSAKTISSDLGQIFVYQGASLYTGKFIGTLTQNMFGAAGSPLSLVNPFSTNIPASIIGNDASVLSQYSSYTFTDIGNGFVGHHTHQSTLPAAATLISKSDGLFYLQSLSFDSPNSKASISFQTLCPSLSTSEVLRYSAKDNITNMLPQQIPSNFFTVTFFQSASLTLTNAAGNYLKLTDGRNGYIFSPTYWANGNPSFDQQFVGQTNFDITTRVDYLALTNSENLDIAVQSSSKVVSDNNYIKNTANETGKTANGDGLRVQFKAGSRSSSAKIYFKAVKANFGTSADPSKNVQKLIIIFLAGDCLASSGLGDVIGGGDLAQTATGALGGGGGSPLDGTLGNNAGGDGGVVDGVVGQDGLIGNVVKGLGASSNPEGQGGSNVLGLPVAVDADLALLEGVRCNQNETKTQCRSPLEGQCGGSSGAMPETMSRAARQAPRCEKCECAPGYVRTFDKAQCVLQQDCGDQATACQNVGDRQTCPVLCNGGRCPIGFVCRVPNICLGKATCQQKCVPAFGVADVSPDVGLGRK